VGTAFRVNADARAARHRSIREGDTGGRPVSVSARPGNSEGNRNRQGRRYGVRPIRRLTQLREQSCRSDCTATTSGWAREQVSATCRRRNWRGILPPHGKCRQIGVSLMLVACCLCFSGVILALLPNCPQVNSFRWEAVPQAFAWSTGHEQTGPRNCASPLGAVSDTELGSRRPARSPAEGEELRPAPRQGVRDVDELNQVWQLRPRGIVNEDDMQE
jgi:hypothetical protein